MSAPDREQCRELIDQAAQAGARRANAAALLGVSVRTVERWKTKTEDGRQGPTTAPVNSFSQSERARILEVANSTEFANLAPWQIVPKLADRGEYLASESSFYRILRAADCLAHRSKSQPRQHKKPESLTASGPNQLWSWDITYLRSCIRGMFFYLYLPMDVFSRKIVHWEVHESESAELAGAMITKACKLERIEQNQIKLHADNGGPMKGATMLATLQRLGVAPSFSRPKVSDDNPYSESLFKTLKYCPSFPQDGCFADIAAAKEWVAKFVHWYNNIHLHSGINWVTPACRHLNQDIEILNKRKSVYEAARTKRPNRWSGSTRNWSRPKLAELNPGRRSKTKDKSDTDSIAL